MGEQRQCTRVFVAGATGMVGSAIIRRLQRAEGYEILRGPVPRADLRNQQQASDLIQALKPDWVFLAAARVGGIYANYTFPAQFIYDNLAIETNVMHAAYRNEVSKLLFLGSACIYPRLAPQPIKEEYLLSGYLEPTNEPYAVAKIAGLIMARSYNREYGTNFISVMPTNLYGPNDNFDLQNSHVPAALMRKFHEAKQSGINVVEVWGTGKATREFLHVDDLADGCLFLMETYDSNETINIGTGEEISIGDLAVMIQEIVGFRGELRFNTDAPDGMPRRVLDVSLLTALGWHPSFSLRNGLSATYQWYVENEDRLRK